MNDRLTPKQLRELVDFHKTERANQPHMRPTGRIITDPEEIARLEPPGILSEYVIRVDRSPTNEYEQRDA
ncbi:MAG: hypothetical protein OXG53_18965 [Chloroflexi bacterium]|nr:hypothetical protein [Chloroflexota bacterium]